MSIVYLLTALILAICLVFMCIGIIIKKNGRFPKTHMSSSEAMRKQGVTCAQSQDFKARVDNPHRIKEVVRQEG